MECHKCRPKSRLSRGFSGTQKARNQFLPNNAALIIRITAKGKGGRYIVYHDAGSDHAKKEKLCLASGHKKPEKCDEPTVKPKLEPPPLPTPPKDNAPPQVHGGVKVGDELSCYEGEWTGTSEIKYAFQWLRGGTPIPGPMESTYHVQAADRGTVVECHVTATNAAGSEYATSVGLPIPQLPENTAAPGVLDTRRVGDTLTCSSGTWSGNPELPYLYQWERGGIPILNADKETYVVESEDEGHMLSCEVTATNAAGPVGSLSPEVPVDVRPGRGMPPGVLGMRRAGDTLTCSSDTWSGTRPFTEVFKWKRDGIAILNAEKETYVVQSADEGHTLSCAVTVENEAGFALATSLELPVDVRPGSELAPGVLGTRRVGDTLTCSKGTWSGTQDFSHLYQWERHGTPILNADKETYVVKSEDEGHTLSCAVTVENEAGFASATSPEVPVDVRPASEVAPGVLGTRRVGHTLTCSKGTWSGTQDFTYLYQWERDGTSILGATNETYVVQSEDEGHTLSCRVTAENEAGFAPSTSQGVFVPVLPENTVAPGISGGVKVGDTLTCSTGFWSGTLPLNYSYQWGRAGSALLGATKESYVVDSEDEGQALSCVVAAENGAGTVRASSPLDNIPVLPENTVSPTITGGLKAGDALRA